MFCPASLLHFEQSPFTAILCPNMFLVLGIHIGVSIGFHCRILHLDSQGFNVTLRTLRLSAHRRRPLLCPSDSSHWRDHSQYTSCHRPFVLLYI
ncbi:hypothetical protein BU23DRAFT_257542 [Bimuria novae-zelandiae CBS 107.79]|uniref:Uncharacterized protein n=1 Tax=Bimuria novae-zelandiae CBS 107.79 TaxID=1447943 RepID=A0A6A5UXZ6_9PLEO|nr:hypothetical protein BU23DRAFT_257542 [Bimuria novae-zelandiae CBS 107.79]